MPGHVKLGKAGEPDPDPAPYLVLTMEMKRADAQKPYDPKKSYWCPDGKHGYMECLLESNEGGKATVMCGHEVSAFNLMHPFEYRKKLMKYQFHRILILAISEKGLQI